jgi:hypothetical protein
MRIKLLAEITGTRNGEPWPKRGEEIDLPDDEAATMVSVGMAERADGGETAVPTKADRPLVPTRTVKGGAK